MTTSAAPLALDSLCPRRASMSALPQQHASICPESKGCQLSLMHGRACVQHCTCTTCHSIRVFVANRLDCRQQRMEVQA